MRVLVVGGSGLLGSHTVWRLRELGHDVGVLARSAPSVEMPGVPVRLADLFEMSDAEFAEAVDGYDGLVYSVGPDDRVHVPVPIEPYFHTHLVEVPARLFAVAAAHGVRRAVLLGSYFTWWDRRHPERGMAQRHIYWRQRKEQARRLVAVGAEGGMDVVVLEVPYVFGTVPGQTPIWKAEVFDRILRAPVVLWPRGGSSAVTATQVAQAAVGALEHGEPGAAYPLADLDLDYRTFLRVALDELGRSRVRIVTVPWVVAELAASQRAIRLRRAGLGSASNLRWLMRDAVCQQLYVDAGEAAAARGLLGIERGGVLEAIRASVRASYPERFAAPGDVPDG